ncbi:nuclear transport factor 2 family protein [Amycolatopsis suaedae]|uniref:Nuclear transport factor 2 family protein n=1 Tax=Amycolatopsis suaedae TaxID=2510978 RepID=A0A4Q7J9Z7_9PSEU|nr:nuclear transport factor 2 family protein [Amycolatopsis suaedae]RZQ63732.1 nuclear transport factor 2 family protein [Amycolatopsis suaedae]
MTDYTALAHRYLDVWNETDPAKRRELIDALFTEAARYTDPLGEVAGGDGIDGFVAAAQQQLGGMPLRLGGQVDGHHDIARFTWHAGPEGAEALVIGFDVIEIRDGRIDRVQGFLDKVPG